MANQLYQEDSEELARKQALADMLRQQSLSPIETSSVGGIPTPISPLQGIAKMFQGYQSGNIGREVTQGRQDASKRYREGLVEALNKYKEGGGAESLVSSNHPVSQELGVKMLTQSMKGKYPSSMPSTVSEWEYYNKLDPKDQQRFLEMKRNPTIMNLGGEMAVRKPGGGIGEQYPVTLKPGELPSTRAAQAEAAVTGKDMGEKKSELSEMEANLPRLETVANQLSSLGKTATYTKAGQAQDIVRRELGLDPRAESVARKEYIAKVDNEVLPLLRATFGAQFTQKEGESLKVTLGDPNVSPAEKDAVLRSFIDSKRAQVETQKRKIGAPVGVPVVPVKAQPAMTLTPEEDAELKQLRARFGR